MSIRPIPAHLSVGVIPLAPGIAMTGPAAAPPAAGDQLRLACPVSPVPALPLLENQAAYAAELEKIHHVAPDMRALPDLTRTPLKIGLHLARQETRFAMPEGTLFAETAEGRIPIGSFTNAEFTVRAEGSGLALYQSNQLIGTYQGKLVLEGNRAPVIIQGQPFRGSLEILPNPLAAGSFHVINTVLLEDYLQGVVPSEMPPSWPQESLKAQALAARTYAVANWGKRQDMGFDMTADTSDQVYKGLAGEHPAATQAIAETRGQIMVFNSKPINALFFSGAGGHTDSAKEVWGLDLLYIQGVPDFDQASPNFRWEKRLSQPQMQQALKQLGVTVGEVTQLAISAQTPFQRAKTLLVTGIQGTAEIDANRFRFAAGLKSTFLTGISPTATGFALTGGGWGHGLGMSQWGARQLAQDGYGYRDILQHFYQGIAFQGLSPTAD